MGANIGEMDANLQVLCSMDILVRHANGKTYHFAQPLMKDLIYGTLSALFRNPLHVATAWWLIDYYSKDLKPYFPLVADHFIRGKKAAGAVMFLEMASENLFQRGQWEDATRMLQLLLFVDDNRSVLTRQVRWNRMCAYAFQALGDIRRAVYFAVIVIELGEHLKRPTIQTLLPFPAKPSRGTSLNWYERELMMVLVLRVEVMLIEMGGVEEAFQLLAQLRKLVVRLAPKAISFAMTPSLEMDERMNLDFFNEPLVRAYGVLHATTLSEKEADLDKSTALVLSTSSKLFGSWQVMACVRAVSNCEWQEGIGLHEQSFGAWQQIRSVQQQISSCAVVFAMMAQGKLVEAVESMNLDEGIALQLGNYGIYQLLQRVHLLVETQELKEADEQLRKISQIFVHESMSESIQILISIMHAYIYLIREDKPEARRIILPTAEILRQHRYQVGCLLFFGLPGLFICAEVLLCLCEHNYVLNQRTDKAALAMAKLLLPIFENTARNCKAAFPYFLLVSGWVQFLDGNDQKADRVLRRALKACEECAMPLLQGKVTILLGLVTGDATFLEKAEVIFQQHAAKTDLARCNYLKSLGVNVSERRNTSSKSIEIAERKRLAGVAAGEGRFSQLYTGPSLINEDDIASEVIWAPGAD